MIVLVIYVSFVLSLTLIQVHTAANQNTLHAKFTKLSIESDNKLISKFRGWLTAANTLCVDLNVEETISALRTIITVKYKIEDSQNYLTLLNYDVDNCKSFKEVMKAGLTNIWSRNIRKYGNLSTACPVRPGYYNLRDFQLDEQSIPVFMRPGIYRIKVFSYSAKANNSTSKGLKTRRLITSFTVDMKLY